MGVGTNYFPMKLELVPKLQTLVSDEDWNSAHILCVQACLMHAVPLL